MQGIGFAIVGMVERLTRTGNFKVRRQVVIATDPLGGDRAIYVDGEFVCSMEEAASIDDCIEEMLERLGVDFDSQGRHMVGQKIQTFEAVEYDAYWPKRLEDAPLDRRDYGPPKEPELELADASSQKRVTADHPIPYPDCVEAGCEGHPYVL